MTPNDLGYLILAAACLVIFFYMLMMYYNTYNERRVEKLAANGFYAEAVDHLYSMIWIGLRNDEVDAWERVIWYLEEYQYGPEMITEAKLRWLCRLYHGRNVRYNEETDVEDPFQGSKHYPVQHPEGNSWIQMRGAEREGQSEGAL